MGKLETYRTYVQDILKKYAGYKTLYGDAVEAQTIFDTVNDHYQLVRVGWPDNKRRIYGCVVHADIKDGKIWLQHDGTEDGMALELVELGVPKEDIVLAFHAPYKRPYTGFAVG
jgi:vancomycin permeability regulator SanA